MEREAGVGDVEREETVLARWRRGSNHGVWVLGLRLMAGANFASYQRNAGAVLVGAVSGELVAGPGGPGVLGLGGWAKWELAGARSQRQGRGQGVD